MRCLRSSSRSVREQSNVLGGSTGVIHKTIRAVSNVSSRGPRWFDESQPLSFPFASVTGRSSPARSIIRSGKRSPVAFKRLCNTITSVVRLANIYLRYYVLYERSIALDRVQTKMYVILTRSAEQLRQIFLPEGALPHPGSAADLRAIDVQGQVLFISGGVLRPVSRIYKRHFTYGVAHIRIPGSSINTNHTSKYTAVLTRHRNISE